MESKKIVWRGIACLRLTMGCPQGNHIKNEFFCQCSYVINFVTMEYITDIQDHFKRDI